MNKRDSIIMLPALAIIISIGAYLVSVNLFLPDIAESRSKIQAYDQDIDSAQAKLNSITESENSINKLSTTVNALLLAVPDTVDAPNLITEIETIAAANSVALPNISPPVSSAVGDEKTGGLATNITVVGSFQNINSFINSLETSIRFSRLVSLTMSSSENTLTSNIAFEVFKREKVNSSIAEVAE